MDPRFYRAAVNWILLICAVIIVYLGREVLQMTRREAGQLEDIDGSRFQVLFIGRSISLVGAVICIYLLLADRSSRRNSLFHLTSLLMLAILVILNYPPGLPRFQLLGSIIALMSVAISLFKTSTKVFFAIVAPFFLFFLFPSIKALGRGEPVDFGGALGRDVSAYLLRVDFEPFKQVVDTWIYSAREPPRWGENFLGVLFFWVPRSIWSGKPVSSGYIVSSTLGYPYNNVGNPLPAEAYISFGLVGVVALFVALGIFVTRIESQAYIAQAGGGLRQKVVLYAIATGFVVIILRGAINGVAPMFASGFVLYLVLVTLHRRGHRAAVAA